MIANELYNQGYDVFIEGNLAFIHDPSVDPSALKASLNSIFANNPDCAELLGGSSNAGRLVAAMQMAIVPAPWVFQTAAQQEAYGWVASGQNPVATAWMTNCPTCKGWNGKPFVTYYGDQFSSLTQSMQETELIHELGHPYGELVQK